MLKPALIGGILLGVLSSLLSYIPVLNCCCCIWVIGGGALAAYVYIRDSKAVVTLGRGVGLGLAAGAIGAAVSTLFQIPKYFFMKTGLAEQFSRAIDQMPNMPAETRQMVSSMLEQPGMIGFLLFFGIATTFVCYCLLAMLGGAIGVALFEKRTPNLEPQNTAPVEPPANLPPPPSSNEEP